MLATIKHGINKPEAVKNIKIKNKIDIWIKNITELISTSLFSILFSSYKW